MVTIKSNDVLATLRTLSKHDLIENRADSAADMIIRGGSVMVNPSFINTVDRSLSASNELEPRLK